MKIEQIYTGCLAQGAYYIESEGEAAVIDPLRDTKPYMDLAQKRGAKIKYVFETHFHADFVSGHVSLAQKTGAEIVFGPKAQTGFATLSAEDNAVFQLGNAYIQVLHTPGHTEESTSYLMLDAKKQPKALFSGDTLFIGDVGRPDLAVKSDLTKEDLAGMLFDSLRQKIMPLPDEIIVYPGHGAGSACGKNMSKETQDTLGNQKRTNYALRADMSRAEFIKEVTTGLSIPPQYFPENVRLNKEGYAALEEVMQRSIQLHAPEVVLSLMQKENALVLDTRSPEKFKSEFIPSSINIGIDGGFAPWVGALIKDINRPLVLIAEKERREEVVTRLARVGYDNIKGFLEGGITAWKEVGYATEEITSVNAEEFKTESGSFDIILDVRKPSEYYAEHLKDMRVMHLPLDQIEAEKDKLDKNKCYLVHCAGGYRSSIAASILKSNGFEFVADLNGGFKALKEAEVPVSEYVCPSTLNV